MIQNVENLNYTSNLRLGNHILVSGMYHWRLSKGVHSLFSFVWIDLFQKQKHKAGKTTILVPFYDMLCNKLSG